MVADIAPPTRPLRALVVDGDARTCTELARMLGRDPRTGRILIATNLSEALTVLDTTPVDVVFCDIAGLALARALARFPRPPQLVVVAAHDRYAFQAFELRATDYLVRPVSPHRLAEALRRVCEHAATGVLRAVAGGPAPRPERPAVEDETIAVGSGGVTRVVRRSQVRFVEANGDYARLHTPSGSHLVRIPLAALEERWSDAGFVRIHRSTLVALPHVEEIRMDGGRCSVRLGDRLLQVSRRHLRGLRETLSRSDLPVAVTARARRRQA